jgi:predicted ferric reductase
VSDLSIYVSENHIFITVSGHLAASESKPFNLAKADKKSDFRLSINVSGNFHDIG